MPAILAGARAVPAALALALVSAAPACRPGSPPTDASFRTRDAALLGRFAELEARCASRWAEDRDCRARLRQLRDEEIRLFAEVRAHRFADLTESNYWHRGRLKFPGAIEQLLERNDGRSYRPPASSAAHAALSRTRMPCARRTEKCRTLSVTTSRAPARRAASAMWAS